MDNRREVSLKENIAYDKDYSKALEGLRSLDRQLEYLHSNNYYVPVIDADSIVCSDCYGFKAIAKIKDLKSKNDIVNQNVKDLVKLSLGTYASLDVDGNIFCDYTKFGDSYIKDNYQAIRPSIRYGVNYYDTMLNSPLFGGEEPLRHLYFNRQLEYEQGVSTDKSTAIKKVKATPTGKALSELEDAAFVKIVFYPIMIVSVLMCAFVVYMLYTYL